MGAPGGADLAGADLAGADLREADLREAHLGGGAHLAGARGLTREQLQGARNVDWEEAAKAGVRLDTSTERKTEEGT